MVVNCIIGCTCIYKLDYQGYGNCALAYQGQFGCFVAAPTSCKDTDITPDGSRYSRSEACSQGSGNMKQMFLVRVPKYLPKKTFIPTNILKFIVGNSGTYYSTGNNGPYQFYSLASYEKQQFKVASTPKYDDYNDYYK